MTYSLNCNSNTPAGGTGTVATAITAFCTSEQAKPTLSTLVLADCNQLATPLQTLLGTTDTPTWLAGTAISGLTVTGVSSAATLTTALTSTAVPATITSNTALMTDLYSYQVPITTSGSGTPPTTVTAAITAFCTSEQTKPTLSTLVLADCNKLAIPLQTLLGTTNTPTWLKGTAISGLTVTGVSSAATLTTALTSTAVPATITSNTALMTDLYSYQVPITTSGSGTPPTTVTAAITAFCTSEQTKPTLSTLVLADCNKLAIPLQTLLGATNTPTWLKGTAISGLSLIGITNVTTFSNALTGTPTTITSNTNLMGDLYSYQISATVTNPGTLSGTPTPTPTPSGVTTTSGTVATAITAFCTSEQAKPALSTLVLADCNQLATPLQTLLGTTNTPTWLAGTAISGLAISGISDSVSLTGKLTSAPATITANTPLMSDLYTYKVTGGTTTLPKTTLTTISGAIAAFCTQEIASFPTLIAADCNKLATPLQTLLGTTNTPTWLAGTPLSGLKLTGITDATTLATALSGTTVPTAVTSNTVLMGDLYSQDVTQLNAPASSN